MKTLGIISLSIFVSACSSINSGPSAKDSIYVYDTDLIRSCDFPDNETIQQSLEELVSIGVEVISSSCAVLTGIEFNEICGAPTGEVYIHKISPENLTSTVFSGYESTNMLASFTTNEGVISDPNEVSYAVVECPGT